MIVDTNCINGLDYINQSRKAKLAVFYDMYLAREVMQLEGKGGKKELVVIAQQEEGTGAQIYVLYKLLGL